MKTKLKTITLCAGDDNPTSVVCPGHVRQKEFNDAFKNEGWSKRGSYKQIDLEYIYMVKKPAKRKNHKFRLVISEPGKPGAKPYTHTPWD